MMPTAERLLGAWQARPPGQRLRLMAGVGVILLMSAYLAARHAPVPLPPAAPATSVRDPAASAEAWNARAHSLGMQEVRVEEALDQRRVLARVRDISVFLAFSEWAAQGGWWARDWELSRQGEEIRVEATFERLP